MLVAKRRQTLLHEDQDRFQTEANVTLESETERSEQTLKKLRLRQFCEILSNKVVRTTFFHIESYSHFIRNKNSMMSKMPMPRRKKWWEKLAEN